MCPFILLTFFLTILMLMAEIAMALVSITFNQSVLQLHQGKTAPVQFDLKTINQDALYGRYRFIIDRPDVADIVKDGGDEYDFEIKPNRSRLPSNDGFYHFQSKINVKGNFLGYARIGLEKQRQNSKLFDRLAEDLSLDEHYQLLVSVIRDKDLISKVFIYSVAIVVSISYINMGCALDLDSVYQVLRRPIAPAIGIFSQYVFMPLISFALATVLFDETYLKLGIFIFGCSPGGGASNMWTVLINGNLNLSITMTFLSTLLSIGLMPFWLYTLGRTIFEGTTTKPPFRNIFTTLASMVIFLGIGLLIKRYFPKVANLARRILAPFSGLMILFIIVFGTYANFYMFKVMDWQMLAAAAINVWCGMFFGFGLAYVMQKPLEDMLTIAIETGVQNTGVSIVVLGLSLKQPDADLASAVPVAASIMTPIPLTIAWLVIRFRQRFFLNKKNNHQVYHNNHQSSPKPLSSTNGHHQYKYKLDMDDTNNTSCTQSSIASDSECSSKANLKI